MRYQNVTIAAIGYQLPPNVIASEDLEERLYPLYRTLRLKTGQLEALTGISERRFWDPDYPMSEGALSAAKRTLSAAGCSPQEIGMLIYGGVCRDQLEPATACAVADGLNLPPEAAVYDVSNACLGVLNGMIHAADAVESGRIRAGLVVSCESARPIVEATIARLNTAGDMNLLRDNIATLTGGSGAVGVLVASADRFPKGHRLLGGVCRNAVAHHRLCVWGPDTGVAACNLQTARTDGAGVLKHGVNLGVDTFSAFRKHLAWAPPLPDKVVCHQVGAAHQRTILESIGISAEKDFTTFPYLGNVGTVSLPITAAIAAEREFLTPGDNVGWLGIGSGLNCIMLGVVW